LGDRELLLLLPRGLFIVLPMGCKETGEGEVRQPMLNWSGSHMEREVLLLVQCTERRGLLSQLLPRSLLQQ